MAVQEKIIDYVLEATIFVVMFAVGDHILELIRSLKERKGEEQLEEMFRRHEAFFDEEVAKQLYATQPKPKRLKLKLKDKV